MHYGYLTKVSSWKEFSLRALYYPGVPSLWCPAQITLGVNNVCVRSKQSYLPGLAFSFAPDTRRSIKKDTNALIKSLTHKPFGNGDF